MTRSTNQTEVLHTNAAHGFKNRILLESRKARAWGVCLAICLSGIGVIATAGIASAATIVTSPTTATSTSSTTPTTATSASGKACAAASKRVGLIENRISSEQKYIIAEKKVLDRQNAKSHHRVAKAVTKAINRSQSLLENAEKRLGALEKRCPTAA